MRSLHGRTLWVGVASAISVCAATTARAGNQEPAGINLGGTSFFDGFGRNEEGFAYLAYAQYSFANSIKDNSGNSLPVFNNPKIDVYTLINQLVYILPEPLFGDTAHLGATFILPVVAFDTSFDPPPPMPGIQLQNNGVGIGDLTFGPLLQFRPTIAGGRPVFSHRFEVDFVAPIGAYDPTKDINQSSNFVSLNPYWAATVLPLPGLEISARFHYLYNAKNTRPANPPPPMPGMSAVSTAQAGQAAWVNFTASFEVIHALHIGANGYYFRQFTKDRYHMVDGTTSDGEALGDTGEAQVLGIGPGVFWDAAKEDKLFANVYFQTLVENRPQSNVINLHWIHSF
jgi:hypothetical protein